MNDLEDYSKQCILVDHEYKADILLDLSEEQTLKLVRKSKIRLTKNVT